MLPWLCSKKYIFNKNMFSVQFQGWNNRLCRFAERLFDDTRSQIQICNEQQPAAGDIHICTVFHRRLLEWHKLRNLTIKYSFVCIRPHAFFEKKNFVLILLGRSGYWEDIGGSESEGRRSARRSGLLHVATLSDGST